MAETSDEGTRLSALRIEEWQDIEVDLRQVFGAFIHHYGSGMAVDDILQDTFVTAWKWFDPDRGSLKNFCMKVGKNRIISDVRRAKVELEKQSALWALEGRSEEPLEIAAMALLEEFPHQRWVLTKAIMKGNTTEARVLGIMYEHVVETGDVPSLRAIGEKVGMSPQGVARALDRIVEKVHRAEEAPMFQEEAMMPEAVG